MKEQKIVTLPNGFEVDLYSDNWVPASGGTETPFVARSGSRLLYCWQPSTGRHAYLNLENDMILSDDEAKMHLSW
jgi:hypothetical protein